MADSPLAEMGVSDCQYLRKENLLVNLNPSTTGNNA